MRSPEKSRLTSVAVASTINGRNTSGGNQAGHQSACQPSVPRIAARKPIGTAPTSPRKARAGGQLTIMKGTVAAATASMKAGAADSTRHATIEYAVNPTKVIAAARPSLPSMKLYRFAIQTMMSTTSGATTNPLGNPVSASQATGAVKCEARRRPTDKLRRSSQKDTAMTRAIGSAADHVTGSQNAEAATPAQIATPAPRATVERCSERASGCAAGKSFCRSKNASVSHATRQLTIAGKV